MPLVGASVIAQMAATNADEAARRPPAMESAQATMSHRLAVSNLAHDGQNPVSQGGFTSSATAQVANGVVTVTARVRALQGTIAVFDLEIYGPTGARVDQQYQDNTVFSAGQERLVTFRWAIAAGTKPGAYSITVGLFQPGKEWQALYHWNTSAGSFFLP